ncbi:MAG: hypothetical protein FJ098_12350, partial [Deltaproteobacteria bacterium]|nr:hypothetical protein [Deltaproteobacteria bacterium]
MKTTQTLAVLSLMLASCGPAFDGPDRVEDLRVLAVAAEPSEIIYPGAAPTEAVADITFLVADPALPLASLSWTLTGCVVQEDGRCTSSSQVLLGEGAGLPGEHTVRVTLPEALIRESFEADVYLGIFGAAVWVQGIVTQVGGQEVRFLKSVVLAPDYGLGRVPNANPALEAILRGEEDAEEPLELDADGAWHVPAGEKIRLLPVAPEEARETYVVPAFEFEGELDPAALAAGELP